MVIGNALGGFCRAKIWENTDAAEDEKSVIGNCQTFTQPTQMQIFALAGIVAELCLIHQILDEQGVIESIEDGIEYLSESDRKGMSSDWANYVQQTIDLVKEHQQEIEFEASHLAAASSSTRRAS